MFSIVIPTYKRDQDLAECLESIRANTSLPVEILVLHGGFESTKEICRKYGAVSKLDHARENGKRVRGLWAIINEGIKAAKYDYVMYLNDDCLALPGWDKIAASYFNKNDKLGILVLKSKGIGQVQEFRVVHQANGLPCANYAILNKKTNALFDENYNWFYGDPDIVCEISAHTNFDIEETSENMVVHNHKLDETRLSNENKKQELIDSTYFEKKWCFYKVSKENPLKLVKKNVIPALYTYFKILLKFKLDLYEINKSLKKE